MLVSLYIAYILFSIKLKVIAYHQELPIVQIKLNTSHILRFKHLNSSNYSNMLIINNDLYFTGSDFVFSINALKIDCNENLSVDCEYKERFVKATNTNDDKKSSGKNFIKFLAFREHISDLIVCGTNLGI